MDLEKIVNNLPQGLALVQHAHSKKVNFTEKSIAVVNKGLRDIFAQVVKDIKSAPKK